MRPARFELEGDLQIIVIIEFVGRQDTEFVAGLEERDRDHQVSVKLEGVGLSEGKIVRHVRMLHRKRANSR